MRPIRALYPTKPLTRYAVAALDDRLGFRVCIGRVLFRAISLASCLRDRVQVTDRAGDRKGRVSIQYIRSLRAANAVNPIFADQPIIDLIIQLAACCCRFSR